MNPAFLLIPLFFIALVIYVAWPLLQEETAPATRTDRKAEGREDDDPVERLERALEDARMDYLSHKMSEQDFEQFKLECEGQLQSLREPGPRAKKSRKR